MALLRVNGGNVQVDRCELLDGDRQIAEQK
jgi:hypothetical protein